MFKKFIIILICLGLYTGASHAQVAECPVVKKQSEKNMFTSSLWRDVRGDLLKFGAAGLCFKSGIPYLGPAMGSALLLCSLGGPIAAPMVGEMQKSGKLTTREIYQSWMADVVATAGTGSLLAYMCPEQPWLKSAVLALCATKCAIIGCYGSWIENMLQQADLSECYRKAKMY